MESLNEGSRMRGMHCNDTENTSPDPLSEMTVRVLNSEIQELGEGPHWRSGRNQLLIVDIDKNEVKIIDFLTGDIVEKHKFGRYTFVVLKLTIRITRSREC